MNMHKQCMRFYSTSGAFDLYGCSGTSGTVLWWLGQYQDISLWPPISGYFPVARAISWGNIMILPCGQSTVQTYGMPNATKFSEDGRSRSVYIRTKMFVCFNVLCSRLEKSNFHCRTIMQTF